MLHRILLLQVTSSLRKLAIILVILIFEAGARSTRKELQAIHSLRFLNQDIFLLPMLGLSRLIPCITSCSDLFLPPRLTYPRYFNFYVLTFKSVFVCWPCRVINFFILAANFRNHSIVQLLKCLQCFHALFIQCPLLYTIEQGRWNITLKRPLF